LPLRGTAIPDSIGAVTRSTGNCAKHRVDVNSSKKVLKNRIHSPGVARFAYFIVSTELIPTLIGFLE
jgi:hypothetical protein